MMGPEERWKISPLSTDLNETRAGGTGDNIFQIIPRINIEEKIKSKLTCSVFNKCVAVSSGGNALAPGQVGLALDNEFLVLDSKAENVEHTIEFPSSIDIIIWSRSLLLIGLSSSEVHFLNPTTFEEMDKRVAEDSAEDIVNRRSEGRFYVNGHVRVEDGSCDIHVISIEGKVYRFQTQAAPDNTLDYTRLEKTACTSLLAPAYSRTTFRIQAEQTVTSSHFVAPNFIFVADKSGNVSLQQLLEGVEGDTDVANLSFPYVISNNVIKERGLDPKNVAVKKMIRCEGLLFVLLTSGSLEILFDDMLSLTKPLELPIPNTKVHDFAVVLSDGDIKLWAIFGDLQNADSTYLGVFSGASFKTKLCVHTPVRSSSGGSDLNVAAKIGPFSIRFNDQSILAEQPNSFICTSSGGVMIFQLLESSVEATLQRFLSFGKYEQASAFAEKYCFDMDIVKKARVQAYYNELSTLKSERSIERAFQQLILLLDTISDMNFVCKFCICDENSTIPKVMWVKKVLSLGCRKAISISSTDHGKRLLVLGKKFYTFEQVFPDGTIEDWKTFCNQSNSMFQICRQFLKNEQFSYCNSVWNRHSTEFLDELGLGDLAEFFWALFNKRLSSPDSEILFKTILCDALEKCVENGADQEKALSGIMDLMKKQICFLEQRLSWPHDAIEFVNTLIRIFNSEISKLQESLLSPRHNPKVEEKVAFCVNLVRRLGFYLLSLQELADLIKAHSIRITFDKIIQDDLNEVVQAMLDELFSEEEIQLFVKQFLRPFAKRKNLCLDSLFESYIKSVVSYVPVYATASCIPFEERLVCLVKLISSVEIKLNAVHLMASNWPVPWTDGIESIVSITLNMVIGPDVQNRSECLRVQNVIANIQKQVPFQILLLKYRLFASKLINPAGIKMALLRILKSRKFDAYNDCLELVKFTGKVHPDDVLIMKIQLELEQEQLSGSVEDVFPEDLSANAKEKLLHLFMFLSSTANESNSSAPEEVDRWKKAAEYLSKKVDSVDDIEFLNLQKIVPDVKKLSVIFHSSYPFGNVVDSMLLNLAKLSVEEIIEETKRLSLISYHPHHEIVTTVVFMMLEHSQNDAALNPKIWGLLEKLVRNPCVIRTPILEEYVLFGIPLLLSQMPSLSTEHHLVLESFLKLTINSFDKSFKELSKYLAICNIFTSLRDHEIPLEQEFLLLIEDPLLYGHGKEIPTWLEELKNLSLGLIKYGEYDLMVRIINTIILHQNSLSTDCTHPEVKSYCTNVVRAVSDAKRDLIEQSLNYVESETNQNVLKLVKSLCDAGIYVNAYSLRNRNKTKLINLLVVNKEFSLASDVALVFEYREKDEWSKILQGFMDIGNIKSLKCLLNDIKNITELWVVPEFSTAWVMVSEVHPEFQNLCPIAIFV